MTRSHQSGAPSPTLDALAAALRVNRVALRSVLSALHDAGMIDALRMRLTLAGFAIGQSLRGSRLAPFRVEAPPSRASSAFAA